MAEPTPVRMLQGHKVNPANDRLEVAVLDKPGPGGANHLYQINGYDPARNRSMHGPGVEIPRSTVVLFQNGPIGETGVNGITQEVLLAILIDRLECFQNGPYACIENASALHCLQAAQRALKARTDRRVAAGTEGTHGKD